MSDFVDWLGSVVATSTVVTGLAITIGRSWVLERMKAGIKAEYDERLEELRSNLKLKADQRVVELQSSLTLASMSKTVAVTNIYERRVNAVAAIYSRLLELNNQLINYIKGFTSDDQLDERFDEVLTAFKAFEVAYLEHLIFVPEEIAAKLTMLRQEHISMTNVFRNMVHKKNNANAALQHQSLIKRLDSDTEASMKNLEGAMRNLLGGDAIAVTRITTASAAK